VVAGARFGGGRSCGRAGGWLKDRRAAGGPRAAFEEASGTDYRTGQGEAVGRSEGRVWIHEDIKDGWSAGRLARTTVMGGTSGDIRVRRRKSREKREE
jgi:hypothetical protein